MKNCHTTYVTQLVVSENKQYTYILVLTQAFKLPKTL